MLNILEYKKELPDTSVVSLLESLGSTSFLCALGSNMLFNLKEAGERGLNQDTSYRVKPVSAMEFI